MRNYGIEQIKKNINHNKEEKVKVDGHVLRKEQNNIAKKVLDYQPEGKRRRGRQQLREKNNQRIRKKMGLKWKGVKNREVWKAIAQRISDEENEEPRSVDLANQPSFSSAKKRIRAQYSNKRDGLRENDTEILTAKI